MSAIGINTSYLDWYDIQARQYDAIGVPGWNAIDPLSKKYYSISPYAYCGGNPVNFGDYDGRDTITWICKLTGILQLFRDLFGEYKYLHYLCAADSMREC